MHEVSVRTPTALADSTNDRTKLIAVSRQVIVLYRQQDRDDIVQFVPLSELDAPAYRYHFTLTNSVQPCNPCGARYLMHAGQPVGNTRLRIPAVFADDERTLFCFDVRRHFTKFRLALTRIRSDNTHFTLRTQVDHFNATSVRGQKYLDLVYSNDQLKIICGDLTTLRTYLVVFEGVTDIRLICRHSVDCTDLLINELPLELYYEALNSPHSPVISYRTASGIGIYNLIDGTKEAITIERGDSTEPIPQSAYIKRAVDGRIFMIVFEELVIVRPPWRKLEQLACAACWQLLRPQHQERVFEKYPSNEFTQFVKACCGIESS